MSSGSKSSFSCWRTSMASRKPIFSNALFHSRMPSRTEARYSSGTDFSIQNTIFFLGGDSLSRVLGIDVGPLQPPAIDVAEEGRVLAVAAEILDDAEEIADAVVGQARLIAAVGQLAQAVVDDHGGAAAVDDAVVAEAAAAGDRSRPLPARCCLGNALILCQMLRLASKLPRPSWAKSVMKMSFRLMQHAAALRVDGCGCAGPSAPNRCRSSRRPWRPASRTWP